MDRELGVKRISSSRKDMLRSFWIVSRKSFDLGPMIGRLRLEGVGRYII